MPHFYELDAEDKVFVLRGLRYDLSMAKAAGDADWQKKVEWLLSRLK